MKSGEKSLVPQALLFFAGEVAKFPPKSYRAAKRGSCAFMKAWTKSRLPFQAA